MNNPSDKETKKGTVKVHRAQLVLTDYHISNIIKKALSEDGFDLTVIPEFDDERRCFISEEINVFETVNVNY